MAGTTYTEQAFRGAGALKIAIQRTNGDWGGYVDVGNADTFELTPEADQIDRLSFLEETFGQNLDTDFTAKPTKLKIAFDNMVGENIAKALSSTFSRDTGAVAGTVTDESHTAWHDEQIRLKHEYVSNIVMSTISGGTGTGYTTDTAGYAIGDTIITVITGTGTLVAGGAITFAGDTTKYAIATGVAAPGTIVLKTGLKKAIPAAATDITVVAAVSTLSASTDYTQDTLYTHFIKILKTGVIADGATVLVDYSHKAVTKDSLLGGLSRFNAKIEMNGINKATGKRFTVFVGKATLTSGTSFNFLSKDYAKAEMSGVANIDDDVNSPSFNMPFKVDWNVVATS